MLTGLKMRIQRSDDIQRRFNDLTPDQREEAFFEHEHLMNRIISKYKLGCVCDDCWAIMDIFYDQSLGCVECGRHNLSSD